MNPGTEWSNFDLLPSFRETTVAHKTTINLIIVHA